VNVFLVVRTQPSLAIVKAFSTKPKADSYIAREGLTGKAFVEEWTVA
jgi:hypothetical protein